MDAGGSEAGGIAGGCELGGFGTELPPQLAPEAMLPSTAHVSEAEQIQPSGSSQIVVQVAPVQPVPMTVVRPAV